MKRFLPIAAPPNVPHAMVLSAQGSKQALDDLVKQQNAKGFVLLHLWAPNCAPCQTEMKELDAAHTTLKTKGIKVLALAQDPDGIIAVPAFFVRYSIKNIEMHIDTSRAASMALKPAGLPVTYLISQEGRIIGEHLGALDWTHLTD
ncbi:MAG: TlpA disulfide reductase family protein [Alphaproteobacteria bacterium]|nr:TlpA disulfide reductase family protein [Alphaproteobacteria bacterium]